MPLIRKSSKKPKYDAKRALIIKNLAVKYQVTEGFVRCAVRGDRNSPTAEQIKKDFKVMMDSLNAALS